MTVRDETIGDEELSAYADGQLPPEAAARVARRLREQPEAAERLYAYLRQDARLREAFASVHDAPVPPELRARLERSKTERRSGRALRRGAVAAALGALLLLVSWGAREAPSPPAVEERPSFVAAALTAYRGAGETLAELPRRGSGLDLAKLAELRLEAQHRIRAGERPMIESVYRGPGGERLVVYEQPEPQLASPVLRVRERGGLRVVEWTAGERRYALVGERSVGGLTRLALRARHSLAGEALASAPSAQGPGAAGTKPSSGTAETPRVKHGLQPGGSARETPPGPSGSGSGPVKAEPAVVNGAEM